MDDTFKSAEDVEKTFGVMPLTIIPEGNLEGIDDKAEQEIRKQKKKERKNYTERMLSSFTILTDSLLT